MSIPISEIFLSVQGEGPLVGTPSVFVRTAGCDDRCVWCDTKYAVDPVYKDTWVKMTPEEILAKIDELTGDSRCCVTLTGGNPALHNELGDLIQLGRNKGYQFVCETQGTRIQSWFRLLHSLVLSPKPPSSGCPTPYEKVRACCICVCNTFVDVTLKVVIFNEADFNYAKGLYDTVSGGSWSMYLQVGTPPVDTIAKDPREIIISETKGLIAKVLQAKWFDVKVLPQVHVLLWGQKRGV